ncbi:MAG: hypothetical protein K6U74_02360, partial [Firmicutes bacterium]|nr:hypothetical protein [Bacillota bacterium]
MIQKDRPGDQIIKNKDVSQPYGLADAETELAEAVLRLKNSNNAKAAELFKNTADSLLAKGDYLFFRDWLRATAEFFSLPWEVLWNWVIFSPAVQGILQGEAFLTWGGFCGALYRYNVDACLKVIKNSPGILPEVDEKKRSLLLLYCSELLNVSWPGSLALFEYMPAVARYLKGREISEWYNEGLILSRLDTRLGEVYFKSGGIWPGTSFDLFESWVSWGKQISEENVESGIAYFSSLPFIINSLGEGSFKKILPKWGGWIKQLVRTDPEVAACFAKSSRDVIPKIKSAGLDLWAESILTLSGINKKAAKTLVSSSSRAFEELNVNEYLNWFHHVLIETALKDDRLCEAFALQTRESNKSLVSFRQGVSFEDVAKTLRVFALVLFDREVIIKSSALLPKELTGQALFATSDGKRIYLPKFINIYQAAEDNLLLYKELLIHEMAHLTEDSYQIDEAQLTELARDFNLESNNVATLNLHTYFSQFENYDLIRDLFELIEDARAEKAFFRKYPALENEFKSAGEQQEDSENGASGHLLRLISDLAGFPDRRTVEKSGQSVFFVDTLADLSNGGYSARDSLLLATRWYLQLKNHTGFKTYKSYQRPLHRGRLCPVLLAVTREVEKEYSRMGNFNKTIFSRAASGSGGQDKVTEELTRLITGFLKEEESTFKAIADYDEWDCALSGYRPDWARVREIALKPSTASFVQGTLSQYYGLVSSLKRYFAMLRPDRLRRFPGQEDGDQEDLDAMVEAWVEKKRGVAVSGGFYIRRDKRVRDVAVAFLLDLSNSTDQKLSSGKTILDVEKESVVIMAEALEALGDRYSIYGFNSEGKERVNFYIVKEFYEDYSLEVKQRFGGLK